MPETTPPGCPKCGRVGEVLAVRKMEDGSRDLVWRECPDHGGYIWPLEERRA